MRVTGGPAGVGFSPGDALPTRDYARDYARAAGVLLRLDVEAVPMPHLGLVVSLRDIFVPTVSGTALNLGSVCVGLRVP